MNDLSRNALLTRWRNWLFVAFVGGLIVLGLAIMVIGPATVWNDNWSAIGIAVVAFEIVIVLAGVGWLALLVTSKRRGSRSDQP